MEIRKIMKPVKSDEVVTKGLRASEDIYFISMEDIGALDRNIDVADENDIKVGEVSKDVLKDIISSESCRLITSMMDKFTGGLVAIDKNGMIFYANDAYAELINRPLRKILGRKMQELVPESAILSVLKTKEILVMEKRTLASIGKCVSGTIYPLFWGDEFCGAVSIFLKVLETGEDEVEGEAGKQFFQMQQQNQMALGQLGIIGQSQAFLKTFEKAAIVAETDVAVLIRGENGAGKEVLARYIHHKSNRRDHPFVAVNCAAIPENLIESELFGYEAGAFTGAKSTGQIGKFEAANGGTLFLDEIGDMPLLMQGKLLRAIQEKEIEKLGSSKTIPVDVRIVAATNQPLEDMIQEKRFRIDLYYRIETVSLMIPPLRDRLEDIALYLNYFLKKSSEKYKKDVKISQDIIPFLYNYHWPGNIREFQNFVEFAVIMSEGGVIDKRVLEDYLGGIRKTAESILPEVEYSFVTETMKEAVARAEKDAIEKALRYTNYNRTKAMEILGLSRRTFYRKVKEYGIRMMYND